MASVIALLLFCQALGALAGVVSVIWGEVAYLHALRDGRIDHAERAHLRAIVRGMRWGMTVLLLSSLGLVIAAYTNATAAQPALSANYWAFVVIALVVIAGGWALPRKRLSFALVSAVLFTGWWFLLYLAFGLMPALSFGAFAAFFVVSVAVFAGVLWYARRLAGAGA